MEELRKCPFCGGEGCLQEHVFHGYVSTYGIVCLDCCCETRQFYDTQQAAIAAWNRRMQNIGKKECSVQKGWCTFDE